ncbi:MAG: hypothetical protein Q4A28_05355 [Brachymonas sp.]|nr:hypothetical protein [Brachymonas sp.]
MKAAALLDDRNASRKPPRLCAWRKPLAALAAPRLWLIGLLAGWASAPLAVAQTVQGTQAVQAAQNAQATQAGRAATGAVRGAAAQAARAAQAAPPPAAGNAGTRFLEACAAAAQSGQHLPGCTPPNMPGRELEQLKQEALRTRNPQLMTLVGEAYQRQRQGMGDISQAYRWYVLGAVRGDPQAMTRLSEMYRRGQGTAPDRVRALGYAQLAQRVAPDSAAGKQAAQTVRTLRQSMASYELAQADRFAEELAQQMSRGAPGHAAPGPWGLPSVAAPAPVLDGQRLPGAPHMPPMSAAAVVPGVAQGATGQGVAGSAADGGSARRAAKGSKADKGGKGDKGSAATAAAQPTAAAPGAVQSGGAWGAVIGPVPGHVQPSLGAGVLPGQMAATPLPASALPMDGRAPALGPAAAAPAAPAQGKRSATGKRSGRQAGPAAVPPAPSVPPAPVGPVELRPAPPPAPAPAAPVEAPASSATPVAP